MTESMLDYGRRILSEQPFSVLLGAELVAWSEGMAELSMRVRPDHLQQHGFVHGGAIAYLADNALAFAGGASLGDAVTLEFKINYLKPARGDVVVARARVISAGRSQAVCHCEVFVEADSGATLCAAAQGTIWKVDRIKPGDPPPAAEPRQT